MPSLLYLSPVIPAATGNGLAMRAASVLRILARTHEVTLVVEPRYTPFHGRPAPEIEALCREVVMLPRPEGGGAGLLSRLVGLMTTRGRGGDGARQGHLDFRARPFDVLHVFRMSMLDTAWDIHHRLPEPRPPLHIDMDDVESEAIRAIAALHRRNGADRYRSAAEAAAAVASNREDEVLASFDRIYVCSEGDRAKLEARSPRASVIVLPNTYDPIPHPRRPAPDDPFTLLFVGTLGYTPNADAVRWLCAEIVPSIERLTSRDFRVVIAGGGAGPELVDSAKSPRVSFAGAVPDLAPLYASAHAAVVPIRAGGGTRIKALEAFAHGCPVVTTSIGVAGIEVHGEEHVLIADTTADLAAACVRLMAEKGLAERLAASAGALLRDRYSTEAVAATLEGLRR